MEGLQEWGMDQFYEFQEPLDLTTSTQTIYIRSYTL